MDDRYFDSGVFRTSSAPVTNKVDDRKMCVIHSDDERLRVLAVASEQVRAGEHSSGMDLKKNCFVL
jgi:hypothetical protein